MEIKNTEKKKRTGNGVRTPRDKYDDDEAAIRCITLRRYIHITTGGYIYEKYKKYDTNYNYESGQVVSVASSSSDEFDDELLDKYAKSTNNINSRTICRARICTRWEQNKQ